MTISVVLAVIALAVTMFIVGPGRTQTLQFNPGITTTEPALLESGLKKLTSSAAAIERVDAARVFGQQPPAVSSNVIQGLGRVLIYDADSRVRAAVATSIGQSRRKFGQSANEPQLLEILLTAYQQEIDATVRRELVRSAGEFDHADAATVINLALEDQDSSVREAAQTVKILREQRLLRSRTG